MSRTKGRMLNRDIANSKNIASLSPEAAVLFFMIVPHLNSHGKLNGGPGYIKDEICPRIPYLTAKNIPSLLKEIGEKTNMKWFEFDERHWIHSTKFLTEHQDLKADRLGADLLPTYSRVDQEFVPPEVEVEVEDIKSTPEFGVEDKFEEIWKEYPNKDGRKDAFRHFKASVKNETDFQNIKLALENYLSHLRVETWKKPKNGSTWFNNWQDWISQPLQPVSQETPEQDNIFKKIKKAEEQVGREEAL